MFIIFNLMGNCKKKYFIFALTIVLYKKIRNKNSIDSQIDIIFPISFSIHPNDAEILHQSANINFGYPILLLAILPYLQKKNNK